MGRKKKNSVEQYPLLANEASSPKEVFHKIRNYLAGQFVGATRDDSLLDEVLKCLFCKLAIEIGISHEITPGLAPFELAKQLRKTFSTIRSQFPDIYESDSEILLDPESLYFVYSMLNFSVMDAMSDPIGDAFEVFVGTESRGNSGQFFTPRSVTNLLVKAVNPVPGETILDPACGAGGFLSSVCAHFLDIGIKQQEISRLVTSDFFGIDKDSYLAKLSKAHIALVTGGQAHIICGDSLSMQNGGTKIQDHLPKKGIDVILTNPPFGTKIIAAKPEVLKTFKLALRWSKDIKSGKLMPSNVLQANVSPQVLFVERCLSLLKTGGRLGMVLPESILSNKSYRHVVEYLSNHADIKAIIGMPESLFKTSGKGGTHTKTCLLIATKIDKSIKSSNSIFMAEAKWCGQDSRARIIPNNDLPNITANLISYQNNHDFEQSNLGFIIDKSRLTDNVLCPRYYDPQAKHELNALSDSHNLVLVKDLIDTNVITITTGDEIGKLAYGTGTIPFIRTSDISNWELKADPKHGVSEDIYNTLCKKQDVRENDILMVKDGTYLIGTCAIVTCNDSKMLFQSHLYKIRVNDNNIGINPYLLLALLSSSAVQKQIRSKQFTQDIIDSLGERIRELVLPIPKENSDIKQITSLVHKAVDYRIKARKLVAESHSLLAD